MNTISWYNFDDTTADGFRVYWSFPGIALPFSALTFGNMLKFAATSPDIQEVVINASSLPAAVSSINQQAKGLQAKANAAGTHVILRLTASGPKARLKLYGCTALSAAGIAPQTIVPGLHFELVRTEPFVSGTSPYVFQHMDGEETDLYRVTSYKGATESIPTVEQAPLVPGVNYCVVESRFVDAQGRPVSGIELTAAPAETGPYSVSAANTVKTVSDSFGRISLPLLQKQQYVLNAPAIGYNQFIDIPDVNFVDLAQHPATSGPEFSPLGDVP